MASKCNTDGPEANLSDETDSQMTTEELNSFCTPSGAIEAATLILPDLLEVMSDANVANEPNVLLQKNSSHLEIEASKVLVSNGRRDKSIDEQEEKRDLKPRKEAKPVGIDIINLIV